MANLEVKGGKSNILKSLQMLSSNCKFDNNGSLLHKNDGNYCFSWSSTIDQQTRWGSYVCILNLWFKNELNQFGKHSWLNPFHFSNQGEAYNHTQHGQNAMSTMLWETKEILKISLWWLMFSIYLSNVYLFQNMGFCSFKFNWNLMYEFHCPSHPKGCFKVQGEAYFRDYYQICYWVGQPMSYLIVICYMKNNFWV